MAHNLTEIIPALEGDASGKARPQQSLMVKRKNFLKDVTPTKKGTARRPYCQPYGFILTGHDNIVPSRFLLQTGLNGHHRLLYPVETQNASSSKHEEKKTKKKEEERLFENLIWIWTLDLMLDKPSYSGRKKQWHCSRPNTPPVTRLFTTPHKSKLNKRMKL